MRAPTSHAVTVAGTQTRLSPLGAQWFSSVSSQDAVSIASTANELSLLISSFRSRDHHAFRRLARIVVSVPRLDRSADSWSLLHFSTVKWFQL